MATAVITAAVIAAACGGDDGPVLSEAGQRGREISQVSGCAACHGGNGQGGSGPGWVGLAGAERELVDGTIVVADDEYLMRAILDPGADLLADYTLQMPRNGLTESEAADVVAYIKDLSPVEEQSSPQD